LGQKDFAENLMRPQLLKAITLLRDDHPDSVSEAIRLMQDTVYSFSMKVCGHPEDAEDTMQEVLMRSLPHLARIEDPRALAVWLYTVTRNRCWRMRRTSAGAPKHMLSLDELMPDEVELSRMLQDGAASPEQEALSGEQAQLLQRAVLQLPQNYRIVLVLHDMEDLDTEDVAKVLGLTSGTVRVRLHRARLAVRKAMAQSADKVADPPAPAPRIPLPTRKKAPKKRPAECRELFANLSEYVDGRLAPKTCDEMQSHIEACPACVVFLRDLRNAIDRCQKLDVPCDSQVSQRLRALLTREYLRLVGLPFALK
jgi:RNA polymerase sigma-70 factor (ECF subfamily)